MPAKKKVTTKMIAEHIGMSQSTVSMILSNKPHVSFSQETKEKVLNAAKELGYEKTKKKTEDEQSKLQKTIMILCPILSNQYYSIAIHSITERAREYGYQTLVAPTMRDSSIEASYLNLFSQLNLCGIIYLYPPTMVEKANALSHQVPMVSIGDKAPDSRFDSVELDSKKPGFLIGEHLIELGHERITYISTPISDTEVGRISRLTGLKRAFRIHGYPEDNVKLVCADAKTASAYSSNTFEYNCGYDLTVQVLKNKTRSTAFIGNNDMTALGIMAALTDYGYRIPQDYSVCGFDNISLASSPQISLTTVEHASEIKGYEAVDLIHKKNLTKKKAKESHYNYIMRLEYEPELIVRRSSGKCRRKS